MRLLLLSGGSRGIGLALSQTLAREGFAPVEFSRTAPFAHSIAVDFAQPLEAQRAMAGALAAIDLGQVEELVAVTNAATLEPIGPASDKRPPEILGNLNINLASPILFISAVVARFQRLPCRKVIANISAGAAHQGVFGWSLYCAAKVGMENFIRSLAIEQRPQLHPFIPVNIDPGVVDTHMHVMAAAALPVDFPAASKFATRRASGQLTPPEHAGAAISKLLLSPTLVSGSSYDVRSIEA